MAAYHSSQIKDFVAYLLLIATLLRLAYGTDNVEYRAEDEMRTTLPPDIPQNVTRIHLERNSLSKIPRLAFSGYPSLRELYLQNNTISVFSQLALKGVERLLVLDLSENNLKVFPNLSYVMPRLRSLRMSENAFNEISVDCLVGFNSLRNVQLDHVGLLDFPNMQSIKPTIEFMYLTGNGIEFIPEGALDGCGNLRKLALSDNKLSWFPNVSGLNAISTLSLRHNSFTKFPNISNLETLSSLSLQSNYINFIPQASFLYLTKLKSLDLSDNLLGEFPILTGPQEGLQYLKLHGNKITNIPNAILLLKILKILNLGNNPLRVVHDLTGIASLTDVNIKEISFDCTCGTLRWILDAHFVVKISEYPCVKPKALRDVIHTSLTKRLLSHGCPDPVARFDIFQTNAKENSQNYTQHIVSGLTECADLCMTAIWCHKINMKKPEGVTSASPPDVEEHNCELLGWQNSTALTNVEGWNVYSLAWMN